MKHEDKNDINKDDFTNLQLVPTIIRDKKYQINNERSNDYLEEQELYEKICRQNGTQVGINK